MAVDKDGDVQTKLPIKSLRGGNWRILVTVRADGSRSVSDERLGIILLDEILHELKLLRSDQRRELRRLTIAVEAVKAGIDRLPKGATP